MRHSQSRLECLVQSVPLFSKLLQGFGINIASFPFVCCVTILVTRPLLSFLRSIVGSFPLTEPQYGNIILHWGSFVHHEVILNMPEPTIFRRELSLSISYFPQTGRSCNSVHWLSPAACISQSQSKPQLLQGSGLTSPKLAPYNSYYFLPVEPKPPRDSLLSLVHSSKSIAGWCFIILNCATLSFISIRQSLVA